MTETPNGVQQGTAHGVTTDGSTALGPAAFPHRLRAPRSLSLKSLGVASRSARTTLLSFGLAAITLHSSAADFTRASAFDSVAAFVTAAKTFQPATTKSDLSAIFTARELGQLEDPKTGTLVTAPKIQSSTALWSNDTQALVFVTAAPPTDATHSSIGALFRLAREHGSWRLADILRFSATGKYAGVSAELTSDGRPPVITIKESHGGRGSSYRSSASYTLEASKFKRLELE